LEQELAAALAAIAERPESFPVLSVRGGRTVHRCCRPSSTRCGARALSEQLAPLGETDSIRMWKQATHPAA